MVEIGLHADVGDAVEGDFLQWLPVEALEKAGILVLDGGVKFVATERAGGGDGLVDKACAEGTESVVAGLVIADGDTGAEVANAPVVGGDAESRSVPDAGLALVDPHHSGDAVFHAGDEGFADDGDHGGVE